MDQQNLLIRLVEEQYACQVVRLQHISPYTFEDRGIYRADCAEGRSYVLRAFRYDVWDSLSGQVAVLSYLDQRGYPVPRVLSTTHGADLATFEGWTALMISFIDGALADFSPQHLARLAARTAALHTCSANVLSEREAERLPDSRLRPNQVSQQAIEQCTHALPLMPAALQPFFEDALETIRRIQAATSLPITLLHGDCWPNNAVVPANGTIALIDWDCAGLGPSILDLGYLLMTCHLGKPQLPSMQADAERIAAVVRGYCQQRRLNADEAGLLLEAIRYDVARRPVLEDMPVVVAGNWQERVWLQKALARHAVSAEIARIALQYIQ